MIKESPTGSKIKTYKADDGVHSVAVEVFADNSYKIVLRRENSGNLMVAKGNNYKTKFLSAFLSKASRRINSKLRNE